MATNFAIKEEGSSEGKKKLDNWKYPKVPTNQVYKNSVLRISPSYVVKDIEKTITVSGNQQNVSLTLLSRTFLESFVKKQHNFLHLGLVQIAVKPLLREGLGAPIVVCVRDVRHLNFQNSLLALVESDLSEGPFYFNCFPGFSVSLNDTSSLEVMIMSKGIPLAFTYRLVCKAMVDLNPEALQKPILNETPYVQPATGACKTTKWGDYELQVHETTADEEEPDSQSEEGIVHPLHDGPILNKGKSMDSKLRKEEGSSSYKIGTNLEGWKYPKIPADEVYSSTNTTILDWNELLGVTSFWSQTKNKLSKILPGNSVKDIEKTITLTASEQNVSIKLLKSLASKQDNYMHLGLVQVEIKPLLRDGLEAPIIVGLRDARMRDVSSSFLALVETDLSHGPFYFNHVPGYSIAMSDAASTLVLNVMTSGIPLALTYRVVCKITSSPCIVARAEERKPGETSYFHPSVGTQSTTKKEEVVIPESWY